MSDQLKDWQKMLGTIVNNLYRGHLVDESKGIDKDKLDDYLKRIGDVKTTWGDSDKKKVVDLLEDIGERVCEFYEIK
jgi:hypothetical protein